MIVAGILIGAAALAAGVAWLRRRYVVVGIVGTSMLPTYRPGDRVLVRRTSIDQVRNGQIVVVSNPTGAPWIIKRAAAVPGDPVPTESMPALAGDRTVPAGRLILLGDNPADSFDSRQRGYYGEADLLGVVLRKVAR